MAAVVADLVQDRPFEEVVDGRDLSPGLVLLVGPRQPVPDLGVAHEQGDLPLARLAEFQRQDEARVVRVAVQVERELLGGAEPVAVDPPPVILLLEVMRFVKLLRRPWYRSRPST